MSGVEEILTVIEFWCEKRPFEILRRNGRFILSWLLGRYFEKIGDGWNWFRPRSMAGLALEVLNVPKC
jgi:hypothetical protein